MLAKRERNRGRKAMSEKAERVRGREETVPRLSFHLDWRGFHDDRYVTTLPMGKTAERKGLQADGREEVNSGTRECHGRSDSFVLLVSLSSTPYSAKKDDK